MSMETYSIYIYGQPWSQHGKLVLDGLTTETKSVDLVRNMMKNDDRITKAEVWADDGAGSDRVYTKLREKIA